MTIKFQSNNGDWLCFVHAVKRTLFDGQKIEVVAEEDFDSEYDMRDTQCVDCRKSDYE